MNGQVLQLHVDREAEQQAADAEQQSPRQEGMSVQAEKVHEIHAGQIRQLEAGFASTCVFRLSVSECGKQQAQEDRNGPRLPLQEGSCASDDGRGHLLQIRRTHVRCNDLARKP